MSIRIGIVGGGQLVRWIIGDLLQSQRVQVAGVADPSPQARETLRSEFHLENLHADYHRFFDGGAVDVLYLCVPHHLHFPIAIEALESGRHVICEKPLALNAAEARDMIATAKRVGRRLFLAENHRYLGHNRAMRRVIEDGRLGQVFLCLACFIGNEYERMSDPASWKCTKQAAGGGVIIDNGPHMIDTLYSFFGRARSVQAFGDRSVIQCDAKGEDTATLALRFAGGLIANIALTFVARHNAFPADYAGAGIRCDIYGTDGSLHTVNERGNPVTLVQGGIARPVAQPPPMRMMDHFAECLETGAEPLVTAEDGLHVMEVIDACYESLRTGRVVQVKGDTAA